FRVCHLAASFHVLISVVAICLNYRQKNTDVNLYVAKFNARSISHNPVTSVLMTNHVHLLLSADSTAAPGH
ncbi:hypothetical protein, partial [Zoogloea sp.]|uniref:hypothetical protein n=1 Tax=Zoogloea sp. TaxID=49181 RepID=UPI0037DA4B2B